MQPIASAADPTPRAITDVYDEQKKQIINLYPTWILVGLGITGILAFLITGFWGYDGDTGFLGLFYKPWVLFGWLSALVVTLQVAILRDKKLRRQRDITLIVDAIAIAIVAAYDLGLIPKILNFIQNLLLQIHIVLPHHAPVLAIINYGLLAILLIDTGRRWVLNSQGKPITLFVDIGVGPRAGPHETVTAEDNPKMEDLISGDLLAIGTISLFFSFLFTPNFIGPIVHLFTQSSDQIGACNAIFWGNGPCTNGSTVFQQGASISFNDLILALFSLIIGLFILALSAITLAVQKGGSTAEVVREVLRTLRAALNRRIRIASRDTFLTLRVIAWPALIVAAFFGVGALSDGLKFYLHGVGQYYQTNGLLPFFNDPNYFVPSGNGELFLRLQDLAVAGVGALVMALGVVISAGLLISRMRVVNNALLFLWQVVKDFAVSFWIFSLALSGFNGLIWLLAADHVTRVPFPQPSVTTIASFLLFMGVALRAPPGELEDRRPTLFGAITSGRRPQPVSSVQPQQIETNAEA